MNVDRQNEEKYNVIEKPAECLPAVEDDTL